MTETLADLGARIDGIRQLSTVVTAMRGIAAARARQARLQLVAVDSYAATIAAAIGRALALVPSTTVMAAGDRAARPALVLFGAEQGFAGAFSQRVLDAAGGDLPASDVFLIGTRAGTVAAERGLRAVWTHPMPSHSDGIPRLADRIAEALYKRAAHDGMDRLDAVFAQPQPGHSSRVERRRLLPLDLSRFSHSADANTPLVNLAPDILLRSFTGDYVHAQLCQAALHAFAAENEARMEAMASARGQIDRQLAELEATQRRVRQEEITAEIIELAAGETATRRKSACSA